MTGSLCAESKKAPNEFFASFADIVFIIHSLCINDLVAIIATSL
jgi:hypothetical protein